MLMLSKLILLILLLGLIVPRLYGILSEAGSLHRWAEKKQLPSEPMRVEETGENAETHFWSHFINSLKLKYQGEEVEGEN